MTAKTLWQQLKDLVACDRKIATTQTELADAQRGIEQDHLAEGKGERLLQEKQQRLFNLQKTISLQELASKELKEKEELKRSQLETVKDQRAYMALETEIAHISKERALLEEEILKQWSILDASKKDLEELRDDTTKQEEVLHHDMQVKQDNIKHLQAQLIELQNQRAIAFDNVQPEWQAQYERMRHSVPDPIVPVLHSSCSACYYAISFSDMAKLKKGDVVPCRSCYRFLYYDVSEEVGAGKAQY